MKKLITVVIALVITLSAIAAPIITLNIDPSSNKTDQDIKSLAAQTVGVLSLESLEDTDYVFIAVTEDGWIIIEIDGDYYIIPPDSK